MNKKVIPLFLDNTRFNIVFSWFGIIANGVIVLWLSYYLAKQFSLLSPPWYFLLAVALTGVFLADWFSGLVHWSYDTWFDENMPAFTRSVSIAREHHVHPFNITGYSFRDHVSYSAWPAMVFIGPIGVVASLQTNPGLPAFAAVLICNLICLLMFFGSHCHLLGHQQSRSRIIRGLQSLHLLITPQYHRVHHSAGHDIRYAVINGWSNIICDKIKFWRGLERLIETLTGAIPRRSDHEWMRRYKRM